MDEKTRKYLSSIGRLGGKKSKRAMTTDEAKRMIRIREASRAYKQFHTACFWSFDPGYKIKENDIPWVVDQLRKHGSQLAWERATRLCL